MARVRPQPARFDSETPNATGPTPTQAPPAPTGDGSPGDGAGAAPAPAADHAPAPDAPAAAPAPVKTALDARFTGAILRLAEAPVGSRIIRTVGGGVFFATPAGPEAVPANDPAARILPEAARILKAADGLFRADIPPGAAIETPHAVHLEDADPVALLAAVKATVSRS